MTALAKTESTKPNHERPRSLKEERDFWDKAFLAALPECVNGQGWKTGETPLSSLDDRTSLAARFADRAIIERRKGHAKL
jgi:hypothetical protein